MATSLAKPVSRLTADSGPRGLPLLRHAERITHLGAPTWSDDAGQMFATNPHGFISSRLGAGRAVDRCKTALR